MSKKRSTLRITDVSEIGRQTKETTVFKDLIQENFSGKKKTMFRITDYHRGKIYMKYLIPKRYELQR